MSRHRAENILINERNLGLIAIDVLRVLKSEYDYKTLSSVTSIPISTLTRYIMARTFPRKSKAKQLIQRLLVDMDGTKIIRDKVKVGSGCLDVSGVIEDPSCLKLINAYIVEQFAGKRITSFLALSVTGLPVTVSLATYMNRKYSFLTDKPLWDNDQTVQVNYYMSNPGERGIAWIRRDCFNKGDNVLLIDGTLLNPYLTNSALDTLSTLGVGIAGLFAIATYSSVWDQIKLPVNAKKVCMHIHE